jgi:hypothetical protein
VERAGAGWSLPLDEPRAFAAAIDAVAQQDEAGRRSRVRAALDFAREHGDAARAVAANRAVILEALGYRQAA